VGNEVLLREDLDEAALCQAIATVKRALPHVPVGTVDAYYLFCEHPALVEASDVLLINCYPFWEECSLEHSLAYMQEMVARVERVAGGRPIVISETGWPSDGTPVGAALPSERNALLYVLNSIAWTSSAGLDLFSFSSFDEAWKAGPEGGCGPHWSFWDTKGRPRYGWR
jgi:exo-beta-1,3-glucanase (GH17 family)